MFSGGLNLIPKTLVLENYVRAWKVANFRIYLVNTIVVTVCGCGAGGHLELDDRLCSGAL